MKACLQTSSVRYGSQQQELEPGTAMNLFICALLDVIFEEAGRFVRRRMAAKHSCSQRNVCSVKVLIVVR